MDTLDFPAALPAIHREQALFRLGEHLRDLNYCFITVTPETQRRVNARPQNRLALSLEDVFGWSRPFAASLVPPDLFELMHDADILAEIGGHWRSRLRLSTLGDLLLFHSSYPTLDSDAVFFGPDTYRFAAAIEQHVARHDQAARVMDIGCGTGAGGLLAARYLPDAEIILGDINHSALELAQINARLNGIDAQILHSDLLNDMAGSFDLLLANPPYMADAAQRAYRDGGGDLGDGLSLRIVKAATERLAPGGSLLLYTGTAIVAGQDRFRQKASGILDQAGFGWRYRETDPDVFGDELDAPAYAGVDRIAAIVLTAFRPA